MEDKYKKLAYGNLLKSIEYLNILSTKVKDIDELAAIEINSMARNIETLYSYYVYAETYVEDDNEDNEDDDNEEMMVSVATE